MKRILILALASIFLVNILALIPKAEVIYDNGELVPAIETNENGILTCGIKGGYTIEKNQLYKITMYIPFVNNEIPKNIKLNGGGQSDIIVITNNVITNKEMVKNVKYDKGKLEFLYQGKQIDSTTTQRFRYYFSGYQPNTKISVTTNGNLIKIETYRKTAGEQLIENVSVVPKDVLRDVVSILPVVLTVVIAYIATRKGISFIRSIFESA